MGERTWGSKYRSTLVCIDAYEDSIPVGRIVNPFLENAIPFHGAVNFLKSMEKLLDDMRLPQSFTEKRTFSAPAALAEAAEPASGHANQHGLVATFSIKIIFRQNASWQGVVTWVDTKQEESFRSVLELITLMDSALTA